MQSNSGSTVWLTGFDIESKILKSQFYPFFDCYVVEIQYCISKKQNVVFTEESVAEVWCKIQ